MSTGFARDQVGGEGAVEPRDRVRRQCRKGAAEVDQPVDREHADAAAVGQDGETLARKGFLPPERFRRGEELVEVEHAQEPGTPKGGLIDGVRAGERAGVRRRRPRALRVPARLDHDDRLRARRGARRRHELAGVGDRLDVEQDRPGAAVGGEIVEAVAEIDVDHVAERHQPREADPAPRRPFEKPRLDRAGLGDQREIAGRRVPGREAGVELCRRRHHAEAVRADEAQAVLARLDPRRLGKRAGAVAEPCGHDHGARDAPSAGARNDPRDGRCRRHDHDQIRDRRQILDPGDAWLAVDVAVFRVDEQDRPGKSRLAQVTQHGVPERPLPWARADERNRAWVEDLVEAVGRHA